MMSSDYHWQGQDYNGLTSVSFFFLSLDLSLSTPWYAGVWFLVINDKFRLLLVSQDRKGLAPQRMFMHLLINLL